MTSKQRAYLKSLGHDLDTIFHVGKLGVTPELISTIHEALESRELIKIGILQNCDEEPKDIAEKISSRSRSEVVQIIGKKIIIFRKSKTKPKIELPK